MTPEASRERWWIGSTIQDVVQKCLFTMGSALISIRVMTRLSNHNVRTYFLGRPTAFRPMGPIVIWGRAAQGRRRDSGTRSRATGRSSAQRGMARTSNPGSAAPDPSASLRALGYWAAHAARSDHEAEKGNASCAPWMRRRPHPRSFAIARVSRTTGHECSAAGRNHTLTAGSARLETPAVE